MSATIIERQESSVTIQVSIPLSRSMLDTEQAIQQALNQAGVLASAEALKQFDTDGSPLLLGSNHHGQMKYAERVEAKLPIGSGVTEAACKTIIKMRMCR